VENGDASAALDVVTDITDHASAATSRRLRLHTRMHAQLVALLLPHAPTRLRLKGLTRTLSGSYPNLRWLAVSLRFSPTSNSLFLIGIGSKQRLFIAVPCIAEHA